jgi:hypothetical protein
MKPKYSYTARHYSPRKAIIEYYGSSNGKIGGIDQPSPELGDFGKSQKTKLFGWSVRIGPRWSGGPFFSILVFKTN